MIPAPTILPSTPKWAAAVFGILQAIAAAPFLPLWARTGAQALAAGAGWFGIHTASKTAE
jgi:hypothetical protein